MYDIDKAFLMSFTIGNDGRLVKYSSILNFSSIETLKASLYLPTPINNIEYTKSKEDNGIDLTEVINNWYLADDANRLKIMAEALITLHNAENIYKSPTMTKHIYVKWNPTLVPQSLGAEFLRLLNKHEATELSPLVELDAYKVAISASIQNIVLDIRNIEHAYQAITMRDLANLAKDSEKGERITSMSLMNPLTKYVMLVLNMVGKNVIGIMAVGEKVYFNLSYYWNEGVLRNLPNWIRNMLFLLTFNRIEGRYSGNPKESTKTLLVDVNFESALNTVYNFTNVVNLLELLKADPIFKDLSVEDWELVKLVYLGEVTTEDATIHTAAAILSQKVEELKSSNAILPEARKYVDLLISLLLSAATDNAKELILDKINCTEDLAKCYVHLLLMGFDIKDIVTFMTGPYVSLVSLFSLANIMDSYIDALSLDEAADTARGYIHADKIIQGLATLTIEDEDVYEDEEVKGGSGKTRTKADEVALQIRRLFPEINFENAANLDQVIEKYIKYRIANPTIASIASAVKGVVPENVEVLSDYVDRVYNTISEAVNKYQGETLDEKYAAYEADYLEFKKILKLADETSSLGGTLLGMNQGLPTSKKDLMTKLKSIQRLVSNREKEFAIFGAGKFASKNEVKESTVNKQKEAFKTLVLAIIANNPKLSSLTAYIEDTLKKAIAFNLLGDFDPVKYIENAKLTPEDQVYFKVAGEPVDVQHVSYRLLTIDYYNLIKGTWNVFDVMAKVPHYAEILELLKVECIADRVTSVRSLLVNLIHKKMLDSGRYLEDKDNNTITNYVNKLLVTGYLNNSTFTLPIYTGMEYLSPFYETMTYNNKESGLIELNTELGRASFKKLMEDEIIPKLRSGEGYGGVTVENAENNALLLNLKTEYDSQGHAFLSLDIDMMRTGATRNSEIKFDSYLQGLQDLSTVYIGLYSVADWIILYNLIVNLNQVGSDRLTTLLKEFVDNNQDTVINDYFKKLGNLDYTKEVTESTLQELGYNIMDLNIQLAKYYNEFSESLAKEPVIIVRKRDGRLQYKQRNNKSGKYHNISIFPRRDMFALNDFDVSEEQRANYIKHATMSMKFHQQKVSLINGLKSQDIQTVIKSLGLYLRDGIIKVFRDCE